MDIQEFYRKVIKLVPSEDKKGIGFISHLNEQLKKYLGYLKELDDQEIPSTVFLDNKKKQIPQYKEKTVKNVSNIIDNINKAVRLLYEGHHSEAYKEISTALEDNYKIFLPYYNSNYNQYIQGYQWYRIRSMELKYNVTKSDLFHIPLQLRGKVRTQRYSAPGYPCLYLGASIYVCWEELLRPDLNHSFISRFVNQKDLHLLDLTRPQLNHWTMEDNKAQREYNLYRDLYYLPFIIASTVIVRDRDDVFKPEYIVPQLIMEYVTNHNQYDGVLFSTVHINKDFIFTDEEQLDFERRIENIAIPVKEPLSESKFCPSLCKLFHITKPTCDEFERAKQPYIYTTAKDPTIKKGKNEYRYTESIFGQLEERLKDFKLYEIDPEENKKKSKP